MSTTEQEKNTAPEVAVGEARPEEQARPDRRAFRGRSRRQGGGDRAERRPEFAQKIIGMRRVARVMAGGRRFNFSVAVVIGDKKGRVGVGVGKGADTALAIDKAVRAAKKTMRTLKLTKSHSLPYDVRAKYCASEVAIRPSPGRGLVAGSAVRSVLELAGVSDVTAKLFTRSRNPINNARAAMKALETLSEKRI